MPEWLLVTVGVLAAIVVIYGFARLAVARPSRSTRKEQSTWDDTNMVSGDGGGPD